MYEQVPLDDPQGKGITEKQLRDDLDEMASDYQITA